MVEVVERRINDSMQNKVNKLLKTSLSEQYKLKFWKIYYSLASLLPFRIPLKHFIRIEKKNLLGQFLFMILILWEPKYIRIRWSTNIPISERDSEKPRKQNWNIIFFINVSSNQCFSNSINFNNLIKSVLFLK